VRNGVENAEQIRAGAAHHGHVVDKDDIRWLVGRLEGCPHETVSKIDDRNRIGDFVHHPGLRRAAEPHRDRLDSDGDPRPEDRRARDEIEDRERALRRIHREQNRSLKINGMRLARLEALVVLRRHRERRSAGEDERENVTGQNERVVHDS
jgi:hypothetical protein